MWYALLFYIIWCAFLYFYQDRMIFLPHLAPPPLHRAGDNVIVTSVPVNGGRVEAWFIPAPDAGPDNPAPVAVFFHGNAELIDYQDHIVAGYRRMGFSVLLPESRGYGRSSGTPSQKRSLEDNLRFMDWLATRADVDMQRIVYHGRSLGGGPAFDLAVHRPPAAIVAESTFSSLLSMSRKYLVPSFLVRDPFRNDRVAAQSDIPILILHGTHDRVIPIAHARRLSDAARHSELVTFKAGHNDFPGEENRDAYWQSIESFLRRNGVLGERRNRIGPAQP